MMWKKIVLVIGILTAFAILVMPGVSAQNIIYFAPQHGVIQESSNNMTVQVRANLSADSPINMWQTNITFDPACVSVTDVTYPAVRNWFSTAPPMGWWSSGEIKIGNVRLNCGDAGNDILLANLTIHGEAWDCTSPLNFTGIVNATRFIGCTQESPSRKYHTAWINGTVTIETGEQNGEEPHAPGDGGPGGSRGAGGASQPSPSPTLTPTATPTVTETPTLAPTFTPPAATPTQTPSLTTLPPTTIEQKRILILVIGLMAVSIMGIIIYVALKLRKK